MKDFKIIELMELFDEGEVTTADQIDRPQKALDREMFQDASERFNQAQVDELVLLKVIEVKENIKEIHCQKQNRKKLKKLFLIQSLILISIDMELKNIQQVIKT